MMTENSNDLLTTFKLLDENDAEFVEYARIPSYIYVGEFTKKEHPEIFNFLQLKKDKDCTILVYHTENFYMIDDDGIVQVNGCDAPYIEISQGINIVKTLYLSKNDMIAVSRFMINYYEDIVNDYKTIIKKVKNDR